MKYILIAAIVMVILQFLIGRFSKSLLHGALLPLVWVIGVGAFYLMHRLHAFESIALLVGGLIVLLLIFSGARGIRGAKNALRDQN